MEIQFQADIPGDPEILAMEVEFWADILFQLILILQPMYYIPFWRTQLQESGIHFWASTTSSWQPMQTQCNVWSGVEQISCTLPLQTEPSKCGSQMWVSCVWSEHSPFSSMFEANSRKSTHGNRKHCPGKTFNPTTLESTLGGWHYTAAAGFPQGNWPGYIWKTLILGQQSVQQQLGYQQRRLWLLRSPWLFFFSFFLSLCITLQH